MAARKLSLKKRGVERLLKYCGTRDGLRIALDAAPPSYRRELFDMLKPFLKFEITFEAVMGIRL